MPDTCSGPISPDIVYPCTTPSGTGTDTFTLSVPAAPDVLLFRDLPVDDFSGEPLPITVTAPDSTTVTCAEPVQLFECAITQTGTYTLAVTNEGSSYTLAYTALLSEPTCPAASASFTAPTMSGTLAAGEVGACYSLDMPTGHVLDVNVAPTDGTAGVTVFDSTGAPACAAGFSADCTLTGTGPYRVLVASPFGGGMNYMLQLNDITDPAGCAVAAQETYGQVPSSSTDRCRTLTVATVGDYQVYVDNRGTPGTLYTEAGSPACTTAGPFPYCDLAAGTYSFVVDSDFPPLLNFAVVFIAADESRGCEAAGDTGFATGPATGTFAGAGEVTCLTLPTPSGKADHFFDEPATAASQAPAAQVVDSTGAEQCLNDNGTLADFTFTTCTLTGKAPFRVLLSSAAAGSRYRFLVQRTDSTAGCAAWPRSGFGGSWGATVAVTAVSYVKCLAIPAGQHSTGEMFDFSNPANVTDGAIDVFDPAGGEPCQQATPVFCSLEAGVTYTALVSTVNPHGDTYHLVRRDVSKTATCAEPKSTVPGGPSTTFTLTSDLDALCWRVTAAMADKLVFNVRTVAPSPAGAVLAVTDASGAIVCRQSPGPYCRLTKNTDYQVIVTASGYSGVAITAHLDTWRVGTAAGWAPQCAEHQFSAAATWGPVSGTLTENAAGYCAVINNLEPNQTFGIFGTDTAGYPEAASVNIYTPGDWTVQFVDGVCGTSQFGQFGASCATNEETQPIGPGILLLTSGNSPNPTGYTMQGVCDFPCAKRPPPATITSVTPAAQAAGPNRLIVVTGTHLTLATEFVLASNGTPANSSQIAFPQSVNAAGTRLTLLLNTTGLTPGLYDAVLNGVGYTAGTPSPGYLPGAYRITAGPAVAPPSRFVPVRPARILDTRAGLGARKARVAGAGTVTIRVGGVGGVPAKAVTAAVLEVTAVNPAAGGSLVIYPAGVPRPTVTDVSFAAGRTATNLVVVPVRGGEISIHNASAGKLDLTADVAGYYTSGAGSVLTATGPARILDTRRGLGAPKARVGAGRTVTVRAAGAGGVPAKGVTAVAVEVTAIGPAATGHLTAFAAGTARPGVTDLSFSAGRTTTDLLVVPVRSGEISLYNASAGKLDLTADVVGYYSASGQGFRPVGPMRVLDTRTGLGGGGGTVLPHAAAISEITNVTNLTDTSGGVTAVVLNVTVTGAARSGALTAFPDGQAVPGAASLAFAAGQTVSGLVIVPVVNGDIDFYNNSSGNIQVVADIEGYYTT